MLMASRVFNVFCFLTIFLCFKANLFIRLRLPLPAKLLLMLRAGPFPQSESSRAVHRIAHPTDLNLASENALTWAIHLAKANDADLLLLHVVAPATRIFESPPPTKAQAELELSLMLTQAKLNDLRARAFVLCGASSIDHQILRAARLERIDLIVMGTRGRTGLSRLLVGSVASRVISRARCPVLIIPNRSIEEPRGSKHELDLGTAHG
jgi:universal stress protein A